MTPIAVPEGFFVVLVVSAGSLGILPHPLLYIFILQKLHFVLS